MVSIKEMVETIGWFVDAHQPREYVVLFIEILTHSVEEPNKWRFMKKSDGLFDETVAEQAKNDPTSKAINECEGLVQIVN